MAINKPQVVLNFGCFLFGFQDCRQQGCCRQGYMDVFTPCLEGHTEATCNKLTTIIIFTHLFGDLTPLHGFVKKSGRKILQDFRTQISSQNRAQLKFLG